MDHLAWTGIVLALITLIVNTFFNTSISGDKTAKKKVTIAGVIVLVVGILGLFLTVIVQYKESNEKKIERKETERKIWQDSVRNLNQHKLDSVLSADLKVELELSKKLLLTTEALNDELDERLYRQELDLKRQREEIIKSRFLFEEDQVSMDVSFFYTSFQIRNKLSSNDMQNTMIFYSNIVDSLFVQGDMELAEMFLPYLKNLQFRIDIIKGEKDDFVSFLSDVDIIFDCPQVRQLENRSMSIQIFPLPQLGGISVYVRNLPLRIEWKNYSFQVLQNFANNVLVVGLVSDSLRPYNDQILESPLNNYRGILIDAFTGIVEGNPKKYLLTSVDLHHKYNTLISESGDGFKKLTSGKFPGRFVSNSYDFLLQDNLINN